MLADKPTSPLKGKRLFLLALSIAEFLGFSAYWLFMVAKIGSLTISLGGVGLSLGLAGFTYGFITSYWKKRALHKSVEPEIEQGEDIFK